MVEIAARLVAEEGWGGLTLRAVQAASGQRNKSAAAYHFGSRDGLIEAVLVHGMTPVNARRQEMLDDLDRLAGGPTLRDLADVLVRPLAECTVGQPSSTYVRFLHQGSADPLLADLVRTTYVASSFLAVRERLASHEDLGAIPEALRFTRIDLAVATFTYALSRWESAIAAGRTVVLDAAGDARLEDLIDVVTSMVAAPVSASTAAHLSARPASPSRK